MYKCEHILATYKNTKKNFQAMNMKLKYFLSITWVSIYFHLIFNWQRQTCGVVFCINMFLKHNVL